MIEPLFLMAQVKYLSGELRADCLLQAKIKILSWILRGFRVSVQSHLVEFCVSDPGSLHNCVCHSAHALKEEKLHAHNVVHGQEKR